MGDFKINEKSVFTQSGSDEPVLASNVVFPAGHIIQVAYNAENTAVYGGQSSPYVAQCFCNITIKSATSNILIQANPQLYMGNNNLMDVRFLYKASTGRSNTLSDYTNISDTREHVYGQQQTDDPRQICCNIFLSELWDHNQSAGTTVNIALSIVRGDNIVAADVSNNRSWEAASNISSTMTLWEVAT